ncbi:histidine phosphatase family protein [Paenibacillus alkalitolerans]|uniref:histidine phosphatase family protein n=1 Tax=Paenibacillus alkalitolerans TaxID=2799335 RepID=UPI001F2BE915|nr:histidine phosphatase family protein [Paenibacillus alkalitolerans]
MRSVCCTVFLALLMLLSTQSAEAEISPSLINAMREGGYILYVRHGEATAGADLPIIVFSDCSTQRNLSEPGRRQAAAYGKALRSLNIHLDLPVSASPFCRTRETAGLAFGEQNVRVDDFWINIYRLSRGLPSAEQESVLNALTTVLEMKPPEGKNKVIVAHSFPRGLALGHIPNMGTVVIKPLGRGNGYEVAAEISFEELEEFVR